jgi:GTPase
MFLVSRDRLAPSMFININIFITITNVDIIIRPVTLTIVCNNIAWILYFVRRPVFYINRKHSVSETGSVSVSGEERAAISSDGSQKKS